MRQDEAQQNWEDEESVSGSPVTGSRQSRRLSTNPMNRRGRYELKSSCCGRKEGYQGRMSISRKDVDIKEGYQRRIPKKDVKEVRISRNDIKEGYQGRVSRKAGYQGRK
jgi:hypothetical protein